MGKKSKIAIGVVLLAGLVSVFAFSAAKRGNKAVEVRIEPVQKRDLIASVTASGQVRPQTKVDVASDVSGKITKLAVKEGQMVKAGQFLLQIDPTQARLPSARRGGARVEPRPAGAGPGQPRAGQEELRAVGGQIKKANAQLISDEQLEQLKTAVDVDSALADAARHKVDQAARQLNDAQELARQDDDLAPMSGQVTRLAVEQGETAVPGTFNKDAATLLTISDMTVLETQGEGRRDRRRAHLARRLGAGAARRVSGHDLPRPGDEDLEQLREGGGRARRRPTRPSTTRSRSSC